jgi:hypothetical protein
MNKVCGICGKGLNVFNKAYGHQTKEDAPICLKCYRKGFLCRDDAERENKCVAKKELLAVQVVDKTSSKSNYIYEYKRTCNECGKIWYSLQSREKELEHEQCWNSCFTCSSIGDIGAYNQARRNEQSTRDNLNNLHQCPDCHSVNYKEQLICHEKK